MNDKTSNITNVGNVAVKFKTFNKLLTRLKPTRNLKRENGAVAATATAASRTGGPLAGFIDRQGAA